MRYINGLREFGKDWKKVSNLIGASKTHKQILAHTATFKVKLKKDAGEFEDILDILNQRSK